MPAECREARADLGAGDVGRGGRRYVVAVCGTGMAIALAWAHGAPPRAQAAGDQAQMVRMEWRVPTPQLATVEEHLGFAGERTPEPTADRSSPLFVVLAGLASLPYLAEAIASVYREVVYGGVVIDACGDKLEIRNDQRLPGEVLVVRCGRDLGIYRSKDVAAPELEKAIVEAVAKDK